MAEWLLLRLPRSSGRELSWILADARGAALSNPESGSLELASARVGGRRVCVLVPGTDVLLANPELPVKAGTKLHQMVPYALEEQLAEDIDRLHFAIGKRSAGSNTTPVAVVAKALLEGWLAALKSAGIVPDTMYCDSDLLPENPGQAVALLEDDVVVVRPPAGSPITMPADALAEALELARPQGEMTAQTGRGLILYTGAAEWQLHSKQVEALRDRFDGVKVQLLATGPLGLFAQQLTRTTPINLLQGAYAPQTSQAGGWRAWRVAAILFAALIGLHVVGEAAQLAMLKRAERTIDTSIDQTFRAAMPGEQNTIDARRRMEQRLMAVRGGSDSSGLLAALAALVQARNAAPGASVQALSFREGALDLKLVAPDAESLDRITQSLRANGWQADLTSGSAAGEGYEGRIQIKPGSAT
jgi:general secretion pathway protein L